MLTQAQTLHVSVRSDTYRIQSFLSFHSLFLYQESDYNMRDINMAGDFEANCVKHVNGVVSAHGNLGNNNLCGRNLVNEIEKMNGVGRPEYSRNGGAHYNENASYDIAPPPIAVVGMGMRLPGGVSDADTFWDFLLDKKDGRCVVPKDRYNIDAIYSPSGKPGTVKSQHGYFLEDVDLQNLDASFFSMNKTEVEKLDPQQRLLLEVVWECMENGGQTDWRGKKIGCYVGAFGEDWLDLSAKDTLNTGMYRIIGSGDFALANRISYEYNLGGPRSVSTCIIDSN